MTGDGGHVFYVPDLHSSPSPICETFVCFLVLFSRLMEVKVLETLVRLLQGDEDGNELPEQVRS